MHVTCTTPRSARSRRVAVAFTALAAAGLLTSTGTVAASEPEHDHATHTGEIDGAEYRVEMPADWNGTLLLYSHGYAPEGAGFEELPMATTNRVMPNGQPTEEYLLAHGYALAASNFDPVTGYHVRNGVRDQIALLDWIDEHLGVPEHTIATGQSLGAAVAVQLVEEHPDRFAGLATFCAGYHPLGMFNVNLDIAFVITTLLAPDAGIDLVLADDRAANFDAIFAIIDEATATAEGRARLALAAAMNNVTGWYSARFPEPATADDRIEQQAEWLKWAYTMLGTTGRADLERHIGGNPSWNTGVDYADQLQRSAQTDWVEEAYEAAGLDLDADLDVLADAPRVAADPDAVDVLAQDVPHGDSGLPAITVHTTGDGGAVTDQQRWYADQVEQHGDAAELQQLYVHRGGHCSISAAEEVTAYESLQERLERGDWPDLTTDRLNELAAGLPDDLRLVFDFSTFTDEPDDPRFTEFTPAEFLRPETAEGA